MPERSDLDRLLARLSEGDRSAFSDAFRLLWPPILRLCKGMLHNEADAEDAAQEAMQKIFSRSLEYDASRPALPWALAIAHWECRTLRQKRRRRREDPEPAANQLATADAEERHIEHRLVLDAMSALDTLSELDRETLMASFWEQATSATGPTLRKRRERALTRLRAAFRRLYGLD